MNREREDSDITRLLADFLNLDLSPAGWRRFKPCKKARLWDGCCLYHKLFGVSVPPSPYQSSREETQSLQREIRDIVLPLIEGNGDNGQAALERFIHEINSLELKARWTANLTLLEPGQRKLRLRKERFIVSSWPLTTNPRETLYVYIASSLEKNEFPRLKRCPVCERFFVARDSRGRYCSSICKRKHDGQSAKNRVRRSREMKWKRQNREEIRYWFETLRDEPDEYQEWVSPDIPENTVGKWVERLKRGDSIDQITRRVPVKTLKIFLKLMKG